MFTIPNMLSFIRLILSFGLLMIRPFSVNFYIIFIICVITDILDGYIARKTNNMTTFGEKLDSLADFSLVIILICRVFPIIETPYWLILWISLIGGIRIISMLIVYFKFKTLGILHTYLNKFTGFLLLLGIFLIPVVHINILGIILCVFGTISAIEELIIHLSSKAYESELKSIFLK